MASLNYPNIVPENNLRLPDALTIEHGPAPLLGRFVVAGDRAARANGLRLRIRHDFPELNRLNQEQAERGAWYPLIDMFNPERSDIAPENGFWISGENDSGDIVSTYAARVYYWPDSNLKEQAVAMLYGRDEGQPVVVTAPAASEIGGLVLSVGAAWVRPDYRGRQLSHLLPRVAKAYAISRWPLDWAMGYVTAASALKGLAYGYGSKHLSYSVVYPDLDFGELAVAYSSGREVYDDLAEFLDKELSDPLGAKFASPRSAAPAGINFEQEVTKMPSSPAFHGSSRRS